MCFEGGKEGPASCDGISEGDEVWKKSQDAIDDIIVEGKMTEGVHVQRREGCVRGSLGHMGDYIITTC